MNRRLTLVLASLLALLATPALHARDGEGNTLLHPGQDEHDIHDQTLIDDHVKSRFEFEENFTLPVVYIHLVVDSGSASDPEGKMGLANVASRMLLRGTHRHRKSEFDELINRLGGELEVDVRDEGTVFSGAVLAENLDKFLALFDEALSKPKFTADELAKLKKETLGQILERKGNDHALVLYNFYRFFYGAHPYGNPILGTQKGVAAINYKDVVGYYSSRFGGRTIHLFGTGAAKTADMSAWFNALADKLTALHPTAAPEPRVARPEIAKGRRVLLVNKPGATQSQVLLGGYGIRPDNPEFYAIQLGNFPFGGPTFEARMMKEIRVKRGWTYGASNAFRFGREPRHYAMYVFPKVTDTVPAINLELQLFDDWVKSGITETEYHFARDSLINKAPFNYDTSKKRLENATTEYLFDFPRGYYRAFADNIAKVSFGQVNHAVHEFFHPENLTLTVVGDKSKLESALSKLPGFTPPATKSYLED